MRAWLADLTRTVPYLLNFAGSPRPFFTATAPYPDSRVIRSQNWELGRRLNPLLRVMSPPSYHILYPAMKVKGCRHPATLFVCYFCLRRAGMIIIHNAM